MTKIKAPKKSASKKLYLHYFRLISRSLIFISAATFYIISRIKKNYTHSFDIENIPIIMWLIWLFYVIDMTFRLYPSKHESVGCQKQFAKNYIEANNTKPQLQSWKITLLVAAVWIVPNAIIGIIHYIGLIDDWMMFLLSLAYSVCDIICILFFCPFQTWFMKNKCCTSCRIYNWDYPMMFTPMIFVKSFYTWSLLGIALLTLIVWEVAVHRNPERFSEKTNACLSCANCEEKLCQHKKQLRHFLKKNKSNLMLTGNQLFETKKKVKKI